MGKVDLGRLQILLVACLTLTGVQGQSPSCKLFVHGTFQEGGTDKQSVISGKPSGIRTLRRGHTQKEHHKATGLKLVYQVRWVDECTYQLYDRKVTHGQADATMAPADTLTVHITDTWQYGYAYSCTSTSGDQEVIGTVEMVMPKGYGATGFSIGF